MKYFKFKNNETDIYLSSKNIKNVAINENFVYIDLFEPIYVDSTVACLMFEMDAEKLDKFIAYLTEKSYDMEVPSK
ncbi:hypothetical protein J2127_000683 [Methanococcus voltae]|uniref:hypothetical protein n=1 Tax=Methanococcus voltae TaxID=2188 RepID=UPI001AEB77C4|nr:hypothetical protein [Methanococcus voltae]MBP2143528.1 hypothetical protein [Methanococcus voltae]